MASPNEFAGLSELLEASKASIQACIDSVEHCEKVDGMHVETRMQCVRFDGNGLPMIEALAEHMYQHVLSYCLHSRDINETPTKQQQAKLTKEARKLFIHPPISEEDPDQTGEAGELLLYLLIETLLEAPQVISKMELKTNTNMEVYGSDGIHMSWNQQDQVVDVYFGESKIYQDIGAALAAALKSINRFHEKKMLAHEFMLVTKHFKHADEKIKKAVASLLASGSPTADLRINHACLIGYNWDEYIEVFKNDPTQRLHELKQRYIADAKRIHDICRAKLTKFRKKHLRLTVFFLPFEDVQKFRDAFNESLQ